MTFVVPVLGELQLGGVWTDITSRIYTRDVIKIDRGRDDEGSKVDAGSCSCTVNNRDGDLSPENPFGQWFGLLGRNVPFRMSVLAGESYLATTGTTAAGTGATTPDAAAVDITGDIDIRLEATLTNWLADGSVELAGKGAATGNQRSWLLLMRDQRLHFEWSTAGVTTLARTCTVDLPVPRSDRLSVRVTLDVNNGASGHTVRFYTADRIDGTWVQLGADIVTAGTTSIFNSSAVLRVGDGWSDLGFASSKGKIHAFELRNGISGTVVANPDFSLAAPGATTLIDAAGRTWTVGTNTTISNRHTRFVGEVSEWPVRWDLSGQDVYCELEASGLLRRVGQGRAPLQSAIRRYLERGAYAYWPLTDGEISSRGQEVAGGGDPMRVTWGTGAVSPTQPHWGKGDLSAWTEPVVEMPKETAGWLIAAVTDQVGITGWSVDHVRAGVGSFETLDAKTWGAGTAADPRHAWSLWMDAFAGTVELVRTSVWEDSSSTAVVATINAAPIYDTNPHHLRIRVQSAGGGANSAWFLYIDGVLRASGTQTGTAFKTVRKVEFSWSLVTGGGVETAPLPVGHIAYRPDTDDAAETYAALLGHQGETAAERVERLCGEAGVPFRRSGTPADSTPLGPQKPQRLLEILQEAADADLGGVYEDREEIGLRYLSHRQLQNQPVTLALDYEAPGEVVDLEPTSDDLKTRNAWEVTRDLGISARYEKETGPLSVLDPPNGVGTVDDSKTLSLYSDEQPRHQAAWRVHLGTWPGRRYPVIGVNLVAAPHLVNEVMDVDLGDRLTIANAPLWVGPDLVDQLAQGYAETIDAETWQLLFNATPAGPWDVGIVGTVRAGTHGTVLNGAMSDSSGICNITTASQPSWPASATYPAQYPILIRVGPEIMQANSCTGSALSQTFGVTRGINGIQVAHPSGEAVTLAEPWIPAL